MEIVSTTRGPSNMSFKREVGAVLERLQKALAEVIALIPGEVDKAAALERVLKIRKTLAWQVYRMATAADPLAEASNLPGQLAMERFLDSALRAGVCPARIKRVTKALADYRRLVKTYGGNRQTFDSLLSGLAPERTQAASVATRRAAFRANSDIWGMQTRTRSETMVIHPADESMVDSASIRGVVDLRQLRDDRPYFLARSHAERAKSRQLDQPIDQGAFERFGVNLLTEFCTDPELHVRTYCDANGELVAELVPSALGKVGAATAVIASCYRRIGHRYKTPESSSVGLITRIVTPCETLVADLMIADGTYSRATPQVRASVVGRIVSDERNLAEGLAKHVLWEEDVRYLGRGSSVIATSEVPRYEEQVEHVCDRLGWDPNVLHVFRCRVEFPPMPSSVVVQFELPER